ncbi:MAG: alkaline phosphatase family protein [Acidobacteria bacterium]|jgi:bisphosphoglycerate-independent phosphoglycerate mutase (AlkP superfamily)|nr:alkaline phosphatase family protein [Acidobacteriota bacterium]
MPKLIFIFLDGVGIGVSANTNPFFTAGADYLCFHENGLKLPDGTSIKAIDARLGVPGMPMSATGQTSLFTGINAPRIFGQHKDSFPDRLMRKIIKENNIFTRLKKQRFNVQFLNVYPESAHLFTPGHARILDDGDFQFSAAFNTLSRNSLSVTTCMLLSSFMIPFDEKAILDEKALYHDYSNRSLIERGLKLPVFSPEKAAEIIYNTSREYDLLLYEFFQTDMYGHGFEFDQCIGLIQDLNRLVKRLISLLDREKDTLLITSDHGNLEDILTPLHTLNPVPLLTWGHESQKLSENIKSLIDVTPTVTAFFSHNFSH